MNEELRMEVLNRLEAGEIDAEQAIHALNGDVEPDETSHAEAKNENLQHWRGWWLIPFSLGVAGTAAGLGLSQLGGWWWLGAGPLLVVSMIVLVVSAGTSQSPWVHVRVRTRAGAGFRRFNIHLPVPVRLTAWGLRVFGANIPGLDDTVLDDLITAMEGNISAETPILIQVDEGEDGERVEVFLG